ncbi:hypothetical protein [Priestia aryabhattai]
MIYKETYQFLLHNVSSTEFDTCLHSLSSTDWDGVIQSSTQQLADRVGTSKKYMKQIVKKFSRKLSRKVLVPVHTEEGIKYKFNLGKHKNLGFNDKTDYYCKNYSFFYDKSFKSLPINAKRLLLMGAFEMSVSNSEQVKYNFNDIVPSTYSEGNSFFNRSRLLKAMEAIKKSALNEIVDIALVYNIHNRKEVIMFTFKPGTLKDYVENHTERALLRQNVYEAGLLQPLNDEVCKEVLGVGSSLFKALLEIDKEKSNKQKVICGAKDELLKLARFVYNRSVKKFAVALRSKKNKHLLVQAKEASAYFSKIIYEEISEEMGKYAHQADSIESLLFSEALLPKFDSTQTSDLTEDKVDISGSDKSPSSNPIAAKLAKVHHITTVIADWCDNWVLARIKPLIPEAEELNEEKSDEVMTEGRNVKNKNEAMKYLNKLKKNTYDHIDSLIASLASFGNIATSRDGRTAFLEKRKARYKAYFATFSERIEKTV